MEKAVKGNHPQSLKKFLISCSLGTYLEFLDFSLFASAAAIISFKFFPQESGNLNILFTWATFAVGFLVRPLGAILFGHIGDKYGCKKSLITSIVIMSISTMSMGLLPGYDQIGLVAPLSLIFLRILQGLAVSAEYNGAGVYLSGLSRVKKRFGFLCSLTVISTLLGLLTGSLLISQISKGYFPEALPEYRWRLPFIISGLSVFIIGLWLRMSMDQGMPEKRVKLPFLNLIKTQKSEVISCIFLTGFGSVSSYAVLGYLPIYLQKNFHYSLQESLMLSVKFCFITLLTTILSGYFCDKFKRLSIMKYSIFSLLITYIIMTMTLPFSNETLFFIEVLLLSIFTGTFVGPLPAVLVEVFSQEQRYSGSALGYNIGTGWLGGTAPLFMSLIYQSHPFQEILILYPILFSIFAYIGILLLPNKNKLYRQDYSFNGSRINKWGH